MSLEMEDNVYWFKVGYLSFEQSAIGKKDLGSDFSFLSHALQLTAFTCVSEQMSVSFLVAQNLVAKHGIYFSYYQPNVWNGCGWNLFLIILVFPFISKKTVGFVLVNCLNGSMSAHYFCCTTVTILKVDEELLPINWLFPSYYMLGWGLSFIYLSVWLSNTCFQ